MYIYIFIYIAMTRNENALLMSAFFNSEMTSLR